MTYKEHTDKLRKAIEDGISGRRDVATLRVIASEAASLRCCPELPELAYKQVGTVFQLAEIYFSASRNRQRRDKLRQIELRLRRALSSLQSSLPPENSPKT